MSVTSQGSSAVVTQACESNAVASALYISTERTLSTESLFTQKVLENNMTQITFLPKDEDISSAPIKQIIQEKLGPQTKNSLVEVKRPQAFTPYKIF